MYVGFILTLNIRIITLLNIYKQVRACPDDLVVLYLWSTIPSKDQKRIQQGVDTLKSTLKSLCDDDVEVLYEITYVRRTYEAQEDKIPKNLLVSSCKQSAGSVYFEEAYEEASRLFRLICPDKEFLVPPSNRPTFHEAAGEQDEWDALDVDDWVEEEEEEKGKEKKDDDDDEDDWGGVELGDFDDDDD